MSEKVQTLPNGTTKRFDADGRLHCDTGPAVISPDGSFVWYHHGKIHRLGGPAVRLVMGDDDEELQYWINGRENIAARVTGTVTGTP